MFKIFKKYLMYLVILGLLTQTSFIGGLFKPQKAHATDPLVTIKSGDVIINELMWMGSSASSSDEWIELKNNSCLTFDFSSSPFSIYKNDVLMLVINTGTLAPGDYFLISNYDQDNESSILNVTSDLVDPDVSLSNSNVQYKLFASIDNTGILLDVADDGSGEPLAGDNTNKYSMERNDPAGDGTQADNWHTATSAVNFDLPTTAKGTPKVANSATALDTTAPVITLIGSNSATVELGSVYADAGATALDNIDGDITESIVTVNSVDTNVVGSYTVTYDVTDSSGNPAEQVTRTVNVIDTTAPTGSIKINQNADVTNSRNVSLNLTASEDTQEMRITGDGTFVLDTIDSGWVSFQSLVPLTLSEGNGYKTVNVEFKDAAGNVSPKYTANIFYSDKSSNVNETSISTGQTEYSPFSENDVQMTINSNTGTTLYSSRYSQNPVGQAPSGISVLGKYFDFSVASKDAINFPVYIKIYFTESDLKNTGITDIKQIKGLYYYDFTSQTWKLYSSTGATAVTIGGYAGYVWANLDHFTPMTIGAKTTPPTKPANFTARASDAEMNLSWDKVSDAKGYNIRYREGTSIDNASYTTVYISGANSLSTKITSLRNNTLYEFGIQAVDEVGNASEWAVVVASPVASTVTTASTTQETTAKAKVKYYYATTPTETKVTEQKPEESEVVTVGPEQGEVKADETTEATRTWVTIAIILIAIGAGAGGYYGYQWWLAQEKVKPAPPAKPDKKNKPSGRW